jgi:NADH-quinone oxidoreductase subunit A
VGAAASSGVLFVLGAALAAAGFIGVVFLANAALSPRKPTREKSLPYECGMEPGGEPWSPVRLRFAAIAVLFVLFDAESALLFSVVSALRGSWLAAVEIAAFVLFLAFGLFYAWRKGALEWRS